MQAGAQTTTTTAQVQVDWIQLPREVQCLVACTAVGAAVARTICRTFRDTVDAATVQLEANACTGNTSHGCITAGNNDAIAHTTIHSLVTQQVQLRMHRFPRLTHLSVTLASHPYTALHLADCPRGLSELQVTGSSHMPLLKSPPPPLAHLCTLHLSLINLGGALHALPLHALPQLHSLTLRGCRGVPPLSFGPRCSPPPTVVAGSGTNPTAALAAPPAHHPTASQLNATDATAISPTYVSPSGPTTTPLQQPWSCQLQHLDVSGSDVPAVDLSTCPQLTHLDISQAASLPPFTLDHTTPPSLTFLNVSSTATSSLALQHVPHLSHLECDHTRVTSLDCRPCGSLQFVSARAGALRSITLTPSIHHLDLYRSRVAVLDLSAAPHISHLNAEGTEIAALDLAPCAASLLHLNVSQTGLTALDSLPACHALRQLHAAATDLVAVDASGSPHLRVLDVSLNTTLTHLSLHTDVCLAELHLSHTALPQVAAEALCAAAGAQSPRALVATPAVAVAAPDDSAKGGKFGERWGFMQGVRPAVMRVLLVGVGLLVRLLRAPGTWD